MKTILYKVTATGAIQVWEIERFYEKAKLSICFGQKGGVIQHQLVDVHKNLSGRTIEEQVTLEAYSRISKQIDKGYCTSIEEAKNSIGLNSFKMPRPMLAHKLVDRPNTDYKKCFVQYKYNGHRCLIASTENGLIAYSRGGKPIKTIDHILNNLDLPTGLILDGELYVHNMQLQNTGSLIRKVQPGNEKLSFICYDVMIDRTYEKRFDMLCSLSFPDTIIVAPTRFGDYIPDLHEELHYVTSIGYEGLILRTNDKGYETGKRSSSLLKVKKFQDAEFMIMNVQPSADGWGILECMDIITGVKFRVSAPGTIGEKIEILTNKKHYIGKFINVEYFDITNDGKPFHPVAKYFRD